LQKFRAVLLPTVKGSQLLQSLHLLELPLQRALRFLHGNVDVFAVFSELLVKKSTYDPYKVPVFVPEYTHSDGVSCTYSGTEQ